MAGGCAANKSVGRVTGRQQGGIAEKSKVDKNMIDWETTSIIT